MNMSNLFTPGLTFNLCDDFHISPTHREENVQEGPGETRTQCGAVKSVCDIRVQESPVTGFRPCFILISEMKDDGFLFDTG